MSDVETAEPPTGASRSLDDLATDLQRIRVEAGAVSYGEIAARVSRNREQQGMTPQAARVPRSSVYDVFRLGRKRVSAELVGEIVRALDGTDDEAEAWRQRAIAARYELIAAPSPRAARAPRATVGATAQGNPSLVFAVVLCVAMVGVNHALNFSATALHLPLYLDMVGTAFASFAFGPWAGAAVGVATNLVGNLMNGDFSGTWFALAQIAGAVLWGYGFRRWIRRSLWMLLPLNAVVALACSLVAVPILVLAFDGSTGAPADIAVSTVPALGDQLWGAVFAKNILTSLPDKQLSGFVALGMLLLIQRYGPEVLARRACD